jgi:hypothetical protein
MGLTMEAGFQSQQPVEGEVVLLIHCKHILQYFDSLGLLNYLSTTLVSLHYCYRGAASLIHAFFVHI